MSNGRTKSDKDKNGRTKSDQEIAAELAGHIAHAMSAWRSMGVSGQNVLKAIKKRQKKKRSEDLKKQQIGSSMKRGGRVRRKAKY